jgi:tRNA C32,U32 (ribose-2'-O)-methylase TrmJ
MAKVFIGGNKMNHFFGNTDSDPDAGDKAWDKEKERDLEEWLKHIRMKAVLENNNTDMLMGIIEQYRGKK